MVKLKNKEELKKKFLLALRQSGGIIQPAVNNTGIERFHHYEWLAEDKEYEKELRKIQDQTTDYVEGKLMKLIASDNIKAITYYLSNKGKQNGFGKPETQVNVQTNIGVIWELKKLQDVYKRQLQKD